jgi:hypothetical protein
MTVSLLRNGAPVAPGKTIISLDRRADPLTHAASDEQIAEIASSGAPITWGNTPTPCASLPGRRQTNWLIMP